MKKIKKFLLLLPPLAIPAGMILWLFWGDGWKISIIGFITTLSILFGAAVKKAMIKEEERTNEGT